MPKSGVTKKRTAKKAAPKKAAKKAATKKTAAKKAPARKAPANKAPAKKAAAKKAPANKAPAKKAAKKKQAPRAAGKRAADQAARAATSPIVTLKGGDTGSAKPKLRPVGARVKKVGVANVPPASASSKRNFGLRGAAPWVARHAAKHAEELRKRNAEPAPPGSARATLRVPPEAEEIKANIKALHQLTTKIRALRKRLDKNFFEIGQLLDEVQRLEYHVAKGYSSFEAFLDREIDLPRGVSLRLIRICHTFQRETAYDFGIDRLTTALAALDGEITTAPASHPSSRGWSSTALPPKPPIRFDD